jgi:hypothetical protein
MATERDIRAAERARLQSLVDEFGSEREQNHLVISSWRDGLPDPELLARLARRVQLRAKLGLPLAECGGSPETHSCSCLVRALDESSTGSKRAVLRLAASLHWSPPPRRERVLPEAVTPPPREAVAGPREANGRVEEPCPQPKSTPELEPPFRIIHRTRKWFDDTESPVF